MNRQLYTRQILPACLGLVALFSSWNAAAQSNNPAFNQSAEQTSSSTIQLVSANSELLPTAPEATDFREIWAYLMTGEERFIPTAAPITDIAYFSARINNRGELFGIPPIERLNTIKARKHLVVAEVTNQTTLHFVLNPAYPLRDKLITDILAAARPYDGVNIDFELLPLGDAENFYEFLRLLKKGMGTKILSVCVPARTRLMQDAYNYATLAAIADRVFVMAYDEHWSGSAAGPVASLGWTQRVAQWAMQSVGAEKLIMGLPFYGRAWGETNPAGAYKFSSLARLMQEKQLQHGRTAEGIPTFTFNETINYTVYFDDSHSLHRRAVTYSDTGVRKIGFWRLGQEDPDIWKMIKAR